MTYQLALAVGLAALGVSAHAKPLSIHTSIADVDCVINESSELEKEPEIDHFTKECPGLGGYRVIVSGGDLRYGITLDYQGTQVALDYQGSFHEPGSSKIEWVYERQPILGARDNPSEAKYLALIHRINYQTMNENGDLGESTKLYVTKLAGKDSCVVGVVAAVKDMNAKATALGAKAQSLPCLKIDE